MPSMTPLIHRGPVLWLMGWGLICSVRNRAKKNPNPAQNNPHDINPMMHNRVTHPTVITVNSPMTQTMRQEKDITGSLCREKYHAIPIPRATGIHNTQRWRSDSSPVSKVWQMCWIMVCNDTQRLKTDQRLVGICTDGLA